MSGLYHISSANQVERPSRDDGFRRWIGVLRHCRLLSVYQAGPLPTSMRRVPHTSSCRLSSQNPPVSFISVDNPPTVTQTPCGQPMAGRTTCPCPHDTARVVTAPPTPFRR
ncbi:hypothetical protein JCM18916_1080 [Cutibacterium acnes JCM 18916]|nr:hypothetical protein JCM18916_1080 [Cutibacterium acnes JCM 18916]